MVEEPESPVTSLKALPMSSNLSHISATSNSSIPDGWGRAISPEAEPSLTALEDHAARQRVLQMHHARKSSFNLDPSLTPENEGATPPATTTTPTAARTPQEASPRLPGAARSVSDDDLVPTAGNSTSANKGNVSSGLPVMAVDGHPVAMAYKTLAGDSARTAKDAAATESHSEAEQAIDQQQQSPVAAGSSSDAVNTPTNLQPQESETAAKRLSSDIQRSTGNRSSRSTRSLRALARPDPPTSILPEPTPDVTRDMPGSLPTAGAVQSSGGTSYPVAAEGAGDDDTIGIANTASQPQPAGHESAPISEERTQEPAPAEKLAASSNGEGTKKPSLNGAAQTPPIFRGGGGLGGGVDRPMSANSYRSEGLASEIGSAYFPEEIAADPSAARLFGSLGELFATERRKVSEHQAQLKQWQSRVSEQEEHVTNLSKEVQARDLRTRELEQEVDKLRARSNELEETSRAKLELEGSLSKLRSELEHERQAREAALAEIQAQKSKELEEERRARESALAELEQQRSREREGLMSEIEKLRSQLDAHARERDAATGRLDKIRQLLQSAAEE